MASQSVQDSQTVPGGDHGIGWIGVLVAGLIALGAGVYVLAAPDNATRIIIGIISIVLVIASLMHLLLAFRRGISEFAARVACFSSGVAITAGVIVSVDLFHDVVTSEGARGILAGGLVIFGIFGLLGLVRYREPGHTLRMLVTCIFALAFAALLVLNLHRDNLHTSWFGIALVVVGLILLAVGIFQMRGHTQATARETAPAAGQPMRPGDIPKGPERMRSGAASGDLDESPAPEVAASPGGRPSLAGRPSMPSGSASSGVAGADVGSDDGLTSDGPASPGQATRMRLFDQSRSASRPDTSDEG